jgi:molybdopterin-containing oxidoreductase family membrane subunit
MDLSEPKQNLDDPIHGPELVTGGQTNASVTDTICALVERPRPSRAWYAAFVFSGLWVAVLFAMLGYLFLRGVGVWGVMNPTAWGFGIINMIFWIGIGHAGTLISAILFLFRQKWRTSINRFAEAMTIFALMCAAIFPTVHVGRPWVIYWVLPVPNFMGLWPNFRSPIPWDAFAISTYLIVSLMFWYVGMIPDLATLRDRAVSRLRFYIYGILSMGWRGSARHWHHYEWAYLLLAALATPLVVSVHSVISFDFAVAILPGWHSTIFPPYFVAGAIFSGLAMVVTLAVPARQFFGLKNFITLHHLENLNKMILLTGSVVGFAYIVEFFIAWYSGSIYERFAFMNRALGPYSWAFWIMFTCNVFVPQAFWFKSVRRGIPAMFVVSLLVNVGMWFERFVIIVSSTSQDFLPSSWGYYTPSWVEILTLLGSFGLFFMMFLLFCRYLPIIAMSEVKAVMAEENHAAEKH